MTLPGQGWLLQIISSVLVPVQLWPPNIGDGLLHSRFLVTLPPPHDTPHCDQALQSPQLPGTENNVWNVKVIRPMNSIVWIITRTWLTATGYFHSCISWAVGSTKLWHWIITVAVSYDNASSTGYLTYWPTTPISPISINFENRNVCSS